MSHAATSANLSPLLINHLSPSDKLLIRTIFHAEIEVSKCLSLLRIEFRRIFVLSVLKCRPNRYDLSLLHREDPIKYSQISNGTSCEKARLRYITKFVNRLHTFTQHKGFGGPNAARAAADASGLSSDGRKPVLPGDQQQNVAVLPTAPNSREKQQVSASAATGKSDAGAGAGMGSYIVKPGDSLVRIAKANGVSVDDLKKANSLTTGNIRIGQALAIPAKSTQPAVAVKATAAPAADPVQTASVPANGQPAEYQAPAATKSVTEVASVKPETAAPEMTGIGKYRWPARGAVIANFGSNIDGKRSDGIAISVPQGTPVKAAENGVVIYAGNGLKQLGNTVLVRHDDGKVTVYGNAANLDVQRGQKVQRGQTIATSGMTGSAKRPQVHFEVRKDATPVNPSSFLE